MGEREALGKGGMEGGREGWTARGAEGESSGCANVYSSPTPAPPSPRLLLAPLTPVLSPSSSHPCLSLSLYLSTIFPPSPSLLPLSLSHPSHSPFPPFLPPAPFFLVCSFLWLALYLCDVVRVSFFVLTPCLSSFLSVSLYLSLSLGILSLSPSMPHPRPRPKFELGSQGRRDSEAGAGEEEGN